MWVDQFQVDVGMEAIHQSSKLLEINAIDLRASKHSSSPRTLHAYYPRLHLAPASVSKSSPAPPTSSSTSTTLDEVPLASDLHLMVFSTTSAGVTFSRPLQHTASVAHLGKGTSSP
jgi:hypothetical protein